MPTINQLIKHGRERRVEKSKTPIMGAPSSFAAAVCATCLAYVTTSSAARSIPQALRRENRLAPNTAQSVLNNFG